MFLEISMKFDWWTKKFWAALKETEILMTFSDEYHPQKKKKSKPSSCINPEPEEREVWF